MSGNVTVNLLHALIDNMHGPEVDWDGWDLIAMILELPEGEFTEAHGYLYSENGAISAVASAPEQVRSAVDAYTASYYKPGEKLPLKLLVQLDRRQGKYKIDFEDSDETRWKLTPQNHQTFREELRPSFD